VFISWCLVFGRGSLWPIEADAGVVALAVAAMLAGQALNVGVFVRLGQVGVFYGNKFGYRVPWCCGFPFSLCADPQYVGTVLSIWGFFLVMRFPHGDWFILPTLETVYYALGARLEREGGALGVSGDDEDERALSDC
jgi:methylene-fatty-acyl-phospholipid synthase